MATSNCDSSMNCLPSGATWAKMASTSDEVNCSSMRKFFSNSDDKGHKENHKVMIQQKEQAKKEAKAEQNRMAFEAPVKGFLRAMSSGERALIKIQQIIDKEKMRAAQFLSDLHADGGGALDIDELGEGLRGLGFHLNEEELGGLFNIIDKDGGGFVSVKELISAMRTTVKKLEKITAAKQRASLVQSPRLSQSLSTSALSPDMRRGLSSPLYGR